MSQSLNFISAAADGCVLGIDPTGQILQAVSAPVWNTVPPTNITGEVTSIGAASDTSVWVISDPGSVWWSLAGAPWAAVSSTGDSNNYNVTQIAVGSASNIWAADGQGNVYVYDQASGFTPAGSGIASVSAASDGSVWGLDASGNPQIYTGSWAPAPSPPEAFVSLSVGAGGWVAAVGKSGKTYQYDAGNVVNQWPLVETKLAILFQSVACGDDTTIWALDGGGNAYYYGIDEQDWTPVRAHSSHLLGQVSVGDAAEIWGIGLKGNADQGSIYQIERHEIVWKSIATGSNLVQLSVASATDVWGLDELGNTYRQTGDLANWNPVPFDPAPPALSILSAARDGAVWALTTELGVQPTGPAWQNPVVLNYAGGSWQEVPGPADGAALIYISTGGEKMIVAADGQGNVYAYEGADGKGWEPLPTNATAKATFVSAAADGSLWGINSSGNACTLLFKEWHSSPTAVQQISAGSATNVWALDKANNAIQLVGSASVAMEGSIARPRSSLPLWDTENPFDETQSTHLWIVNRAVQVVSGSLYPDIGTPLSNLFPPFTLRIGDNGFHDNLCQGLYDADFLQEYNGPVAFGQPSYASHFYDPVTGENWLGSKSWTALTQGRKFFWEALECYIAGDRARAGYNLGLSLHYLTDLTQPMHAVNFTWLSSAFPGYHTAFEAYVMEMQDTVEPPYPPDFQPLAAASDPGEYFINAANSVHAYGSAAGVLDPRLALGFPPIGGLNDSQKMVLEPFVAPILQNAITRTAQYLYAWMALALSDVSLCQLVSSSSGYVMDIPHGSTQQGLALQQYPWHNAQNQRFFILRLADNDEGHCVIRPAGTHLALDVQSADAGANVVQMEYDSTSESQKWQFVNIEGASVCLKNKYSKLFVTVSAPLNQRGSKLIQETLENTGGQRWLIAPASIATENPDPVYMQLGTSSLNADIVGASSAPGTVLQVHNCNGTNAQRFLWVPLGGDDDGYYMILTEAGGLALTAGEYVTQELWTASDDQKWMPILVSFSLFIYIQSKASGQYMYANASNDTPVTISPPPTDSIWILNIAKLGTTADEDESESVPAVAAAAAVS